MKGYETDIFKKVEEFINQYIDTVQQYITSFFPEFLQKMTENDAGRYFLISISVILLIVFLRFVGGVLSFIFKIILLIATLSAIFFALVYFFGIENIHL